MNKHCPRGCWAIWQMILSARLGRWTHFGPQKLLLGGEKGLKEAI